MSKSKRLYNRFKGRRIWNIWKEHAFQSPPDVAKQIFIEDKERGHALFEKIMKANKEEIAIYLLDPDEEVRWLAKWRAEQLFKNPINGEWDG